MAKKKRQECICFVPMGAVQKNSNVCNIRKDFKPHTAWAVTHLAMPKKATESHQWKLSETICINMHWDWLENVVLLISRFWDGPDGFLNCLSKLNVLLYMDHQCCIFILCKSHFQSSEWKKRDLEKMLWGKSTLDCQLLEGNGSGDSQWWFSENMFSLFPHLSECLSWREK